MKPGQTLRVNSTWLGRLLCLAAAFTLISARAQTAQPLGLVSSNRFLFVVDTSASMKKMAPDVLKIVAEIINSSASGQLRFGDSLGLWTFNEDVYSELPAQKWNLEERGKIGGRILDFLQRRRFEKSSRLGVALPDLFDVIKASDIITVFIISNGQGKMKGTPFDTEINAQFQQNLKDMGADRTPIVTVLQARRGRILKYTMNAYPWPVVTPEVPLPLKMPPNQPTPNSAPQPAPIATAPVPRASNPPLIIPKPAPTPPVTIESAPPVATVTPAPGPVPTVPDLPTPPPPPRFIPPPMGFPNTPPSIVQPKPPETAPPAPVPPPTPAVNPVQLASAPPVVLPPPVNPPAASPVIAPAPPAPPPTIPVAPKPVPAPVATAPIVAPATISNASPTLAVAMPSVVERSKTLLIAGVSLAIAALVLAAFMFRRYFDNSGPSLITRTMGNKRK